MNTPHTHPRATEILYSVNGTLTSGTIGENGSRFVFNTINAGQATIFPKVRSATHNVLPGGESETLTLFEGICPLSG